MIDSPKVKVIPQMDLEAVLSGSKEDKPEQLYNKIDLTWLLHSCTISFQPLLWRALATAWGTAGRWLNTKVNFCSSISSALFKPQALIRFWESGRWGKLKKIKTAVKRHHSAPVGTDNRSERQLSILNMWHFTVVSECPTLPSCIYSQKNPHSPVR